MNDDENQPETITHFLPDSTTSSGKILDLYAHATAKERKTTAENLRRQYQSELPIYRNLGIEPPTITLNEKLCTQKWPLRGPHGIVISSTYQEVVPAPDPEYFPPLRTNKPIDKKIDLS